MSCGGFGRRRTAYSAICFHHRHRQNQRVSVSSIQSQFLDLTAHHSRYKAIDPKSALKDSARQKVIFITGASGDRPGHRRCLRRSRRQCGLSHGQVRGRSRRDASLGQTGQPGNAVPCSICDVTGAAALEAAVADCVARFGGIDAADANAGYLGPWMKIGEVNPESWWRNWDVNVRGAYHVIRFTLPISLNPLRGAPPRAGAVVISSCSHRLARSCRCRVHPTTRHRNMRSIVSASPSRSITTTTASRTSPSILAAFRPNWAEHAASAACLSRRRSRVTRRLRRMALLGQGGLGQGPISERQLGCR